MDGVVMDLGFIIYLPICCKSVDVMVLKHHNRYGLLFFCYYKLATVNRHMQTFPLKICNINLPHETNINNEDIKTNQRI